MTKQRSGKRPKKLNRSAKIGIAALTTTALIGGWNAIGHLEVTTSQALAADAAVAIELMEPTATLLPDLPSMPAPSPPSSSSGNRSSGGGGGNSSGGS